MTSKTLDNRQDMGGEEGSGMADGFKQNERYKRAFLRPVAKSVYQPKKVSRMNGSLNYSIVSQGMIPYDSNKGLHNGGMQVEMTQTFNMSILNNSLAQQRNRAATKTMQGINQASLDEPITGQHLRGIRTVKSESNEAFSVVPGAKIQFERENSREDREESLLNLLKRPKHKELSNLQGPSHMDKLMSAPLTMEDKGQFINLPLLGTLRPQFARAGAVASTQSQKDAADKNRGDDDENKEDQEGTKGMESTVAVGPSFYHKDIEFWQNKFQKHNKERDQHKRYLAKTQEINCLTRNTNIRSEEPTGGKKGKKGIQTAESLDNKPSLFNQVLKRRRSRQSNYAPCVLDFDYAGDSAKYQHLIEKRTDYNLGFPNKSMLNFEMNLRQYKNVTEFNAYKPFSFPSVKQFSPRKQWQQPKRDNSALNAEFKKKFNDKFAEPNANELLHQFDKRGINASSQWQCSLRGLKRLPKDHATKSSSPKKDKKK